MLHFEREFEINLKNRKLFDFVFSLSFSDQKSNNFTAHFASKTVEKRSTMSKVLCIVFFFMQYNFDCLLFFLFCIEIW